MADIGTSITNAKSEGARLASRPSGNSLTVLLHARYEAIWDAHNKLDEAQPSKDGLDPEDNETWHLYWACKRAMDELFEESVLVQRLLLRQAPSTDDEATIQALHALLVYDHGEDLDRDDQKSLKIALENQLDYHVGEGRADMERLGRQFSTTSMYCWSHRQHREGLLDNESEAA